MNDTVLISIQPYWVFLIIAKAMGWDIGIEKTIELRKNYPKAKNWNKIAKIYCSKDKKSFSKIPKEYQPFMKQFLGKVIGEFVCDEIIPIKVFENGTIQDYNWKDLEKSCVPYDDIANYIGFGKTGYGWHISNLIIYDEPKDLKKFYKYCECPECDDCPYLHFENTADSYEGWCIFDEKIPIKRPPQSWGYVKELK